MLGTPYRKTVREAASEPDVEARLQAAFARSDGESARVRTAEREHARQAEALRRDQAKLHAAIEAAKAIAAAEAS